MTIGNENSGALILVIVLLVAVIGYMINIYSLATTKTLTGMSLLRVMAIFIFPVGCIIGYFPNAPEEPTLVRILPKE